jgi:hypothetical protein
MTTSAIMRAANYLGAPRVVSYPDPEDAPAAAAPAAEPVAVAHASDDIPVETSSREPLVVAKEAPVETEGNVADEGVTADAGAADGERRKPPKLPDWAQAQLNNMAAEKRIAEREAKRMADELAALRNPPAAASAATQADAAAAQEAAPNGGYRTQADFDAAVEAAAAKREATVRAQQAQADFDAACNAAYQSGKAHPEMADHFDDAVKNLQSLGFMNRDMLDLVVATEDPAKVLFELGSDPDKAASILSLPLAKRAVEIAKLSVVPAAKKAPVPLSNAPRPVTPIDGSARTSAEPSDNDSDEVFFAKREAQLRAKNAA